MNCAPCPATVTLIDAVTLETGLAGTSTPAGGAGDTGPKPVPHSVTVSPGFAGTVGNIGPKKLGGASHVAPSAAAAYLPPQVKNAGENVCSATCIGALVPDAFDTTTFTGPV